MNADQEQITENSSAEEQKESLSVEESFAKLDEMVKKLESGETSLEESFQIYQEGMNLLKEVHKKIDGYEKKMQVLTSDGVLEDFV